MACEITPTQLAIAIANSTPAQLAQMCAALSCKATLSDFTAALGAATPLQLASFCDTLHCAVSTEEVLAALNAATPAELARLCATLSCVTTITAITSALTAATPAQLAVVCDLLNCQDQATTTIAGILSAMALATPAQLAQLCGILKCVTPASLEEALSVATPAQIAVMVDLLNIVPTSAASVIAALTIATPTELTNICNLLDCPLNIADITAAVLAASPALLLVLTNLLRVPPTGAEVVGALCAAPIVALNPALPVQVTQKNGATCSVVDLTFAPLAGGLAGAGVAGQEPLPNAIVTVATLAPVVRFDLSNNIMGVGFGAAQNSTGNAVVGIGSSAAQSNSASNVTAIGAFAAASNSGVSLTAIGSFAASSNTGIAVVAIGDSTALLNTGSLLTAAGISAASRNSGANVTAVGFAAAESNIGNLVSAVGATAAQNNTGNAVSALGNRAAEYNSATQVTAVGYSAAQANTGNGVVAVGSEAAGTNTGFNVTAVGFTSLYRNTCPNVDAFGAFAGNYPQGLGETPNATANSPTTLLLSVATAAAVGSIVHVTHPNLSGARSFTVTSPTLLTLIGPASSIAGIVGVPATAVVLTQTPCYPNTTYLGHNSIGTGPNQAVLGNPTQTPVGWAPFTVISDGSQKILVPYDAKAIGDLTRLITPIMYRFDPEARYVDVQSKTVQVEEEFEVPSEMVRAKDKDGKETLTQGKPTKTKRMVDRDASEIKKVTRDGSRADKHATLGYDARSIGELAKKEKVIFPIVTHQKERGGEDLWTLDSSAMVAALHIRIEQMQRQIDALIKLVPNYKEPN